MSISVSEKIRQSKSQYKPDLNELISQCELNYALLVRLCPKLNNKEPQNRSFSGNNTAGDTKQIEFRGDSNMLHLCLAISDVARYTTTMKLNISSPRIRLNHSMELIIRMYHDAKMLEVMEGSGPSALKAIYTGPQHSLKTVDEKRQINRFIGECLRAVTL